MNAIAKIRNMDSYTKLIAGTCAAVALLIGVFVALVIMFPPTGNECTGMGVTVGGTNNGQVNTSGFDVNGGVVIPMDSDDCTN